MNNSDYSTTGVAAPPEQERRSPGEMEGGIKDKAMARGRQGIDAVKEAARDATGKAKTIGRDAAHQIQEKGRGFAESRKEELASRISGGGQAVRRAADKLREENDPNIAHYAEFVADRLERAGEYVRNRDFGAMYRDGEAAARRRPEVLFGGMFVAGLAIARFLKASSEREQKSEYPRGEWARFDPRETRDLPMSTEPPSGSMGDVPVPSGVSNPSMAGALS